MSNPDNKENKNVPSESKPASSSASGILGGPGITGSIPLPIANPNRYDA